MGLSVMLAVFLVASAILAKELPDPSRFALELDEDEFEDYLDVWLKQQEPRWANVSTRNDSPSNGKFTYCITSPGCLEILENSE